MAYGISFDIPDPVGLYDAVHADVLRRTGGSIAGLIVHVGVRTYEGFQIVEVWESEKDRQRYNDDILGPAVAEIGGTRAVASRLLAGRELDLRGLVIPSGGIAT